MEFMSIIEEMEKLIEKSPHIPLTGRVFLDGDILLDYLDRLRTALPEELRQAQWIRQEKERLLEEARLKARDLLAEAEKRAEMMAGENELVRKARAQATEIVARAQHLAEEMKSGALSYADGLLGQLETSLNQALAQVRQGRQELQAYPSGGSAGREAAAASEKAENHGRR
ncbi:ATPase [Moorella sulfitireducens (nom. illeg.)]|uniref:ATPase n=1 Tax=Neomoorella sulfitireducens TaxID=2972948 RepID=UPI0021ABC747|nr:ATPase [Moorella sulfitireducens]